MVIERACDSMPALQRLEQQPEHYGLYMHHLSASEGWFADVALRKGTQDVDVAVDVMGGVAVNVGEQTVRVQSLKLWWRADHNSCDNLRAT